MKKLILIDGNSLLFKAYYATSYMPNQMHSSDGVPTNALFAFINMIEKVVNDHDFSNILVAFDTGKPTFRHIAHEAYKQTRKPVDPELKAQFPLVRQFLQFYGIPVLEIDGFEADDIIGTYAKKACNSGYKVDIISSDKDLLQLISPNISVLLSKRGLSELELMNEAALFEKWQIKPEQVCDLKGLMGDPSDNIPGVKGVGEKTALKLIHEYKTVENLYNHVDKIKGKLQEKLINDQDMALFSKELATIDCNVPVDLSLEQLVMIDNDPYELLSFYKRYDLSSLVKKHALSNKKQQKLFSYEVLESDFENYLKEGMSVVFETFYQKDYHSALLLGMAVSDGNTQYFINFDKMKDNDFIKEWLLADNNKRGFDVKKDMVVALWHNLEVSGFDFDLMLAAYLVNPMIKNEFKQICEYFNYESIQYDEEVYGKGAKKALCEAEKYQSFACEKALAISQLYNEVTQQLKVHEQYQLLIDIEIPITGILAKMEYHGFNIDQFELANQKEQIEKSINLLEQDIYDLSGEQFNINSVKQLGVVLFEKMNLPLQKKTKTGYKTSIEVLEALTLHHPIAQKIIDYRQLSKLYSTYIIGLNNQIGADGKIHTIFNQALTQTGRLSSSEPNLQNIPIRLEQGKQIRKCFVPSDEYDCIVAFDYSQIELRLLAHLADEHDMIDAFNQGGDIHNNTAVALFGVEKENVDANMRRKAKAVNFGIVYGISDFGLSNQIQSTPVEAKHFIETYFKTYPRIETYMKDTIEYAKKHGYIKTILNRRRYIPELLQNSFIQVKLGERLAMNSPIQGGAADLIKLAMIKVDRALKNENLQANLILQVHDELVFEVKKQDLDTLIKIVKDSMMHALDLKVQLDVEASYGSNWFEVK